MVFYAVPARPVLASSWRPPREPWRRDGRAVWLCAPGAVVGTRVEDRRQPGPGSPPRGAQCGLDVLGSGQSVPRGCRHALVLRGGTERAACCFHCFHPKLRRGGFVARSGQALHVKTQRFPSPPLKLKPHSRGPCPVAVPPRRGRWSGPSARGGERSEWLPECAHPAGGVRAHGDQELAASRLRSETLAPERFGSRQPSAPDLRRSPPRAPWRSAVPRRKGRCAARSSLDRSEVCRQKRSEIQKVRRFKKVFFFLNAVMVASL